MDTRTKPTDAELEQRTESLRSSLKDWLKRHDMWYDCGFTSFAEHFGEFARPWKSPVVLVFWFEGPFYKAYSGHSGSWDIRNAFDEFIKRTGFWYDCEDHLTMVFMPSGDELCAAYKAYYDFRWLCHAILPSYAELNSELYDHFSKHPDDLRRLPHRDFEVLLDAIFRNHGYRTVLGPGSNDGGVDLRIYQDDHIGELITLVQAKRYAENRPIGLEAVAALKAVVDDEQAHRGLFVTTSRFLPSARKFAVRQSRRLILADASQVQQWCSFAASRIEPPQRIKLPEAYDDVSPQSLVGVLFHGHSRGGGNRFVIVVKHAGETVFVRPISKTQVPPKEKLTPNTIWNGPDMPDIRDGFVTAYTGSGEQGYYVARLSEGGRSFRADHTFFSIWDGKPAQNNIDWWS